jgi:hypothetical protein
MKFTQTIRVRSDQPDAIAELLAGWDRGQAAAPIMGYIGTRLLADRDEPGCYLIMAEFAQVDEDVSSATEAERNNLREETEQFAERLRSLADGEPDWVHYDEYYRTGLTGDLRTG